ncbi:hypothetical protein [uncultured Paracoccus sp.]|uniref:hypothetical protein n=1 Tax=uncultured Paracoccus sp. TaxID=189685 RepID=UPI002606A727|nr:hypothetical protein [uncultured Paracoccus sp.]
MKKLHALWRGELPLADAFWTWAILGGLLVNVTTTALFLAMITLDRPWAALVLGYVCSIPYSVAAVVGVWRSASRHQGSDSHADLARAATLLLMAVLSLT